MLQKAFENYLRKKCHKETVSHIEIQKNNSELFCELHVDLLSNNSGEQRLYFRHS